MTMDKPFEEFNKLMEEASRPTHEFNRIMEEVSKAQKIMEEASKTMRDFNKLMEEASKTRKIIEETSEVREIIEKVRKVSEGLNNHIVPPIREMLKEDENVSKLLKELSNYYENIRRLLHHSHDFSVA